MEKKKSLKSNENVLNTASTYSSDRLLFKTLGLMPFTDIPTNKNYFVGEVKLENGSVIKISVFPAPALFWGFEVFTAGSKKHLKISTGVRSVKGFLEFCNANSRRDA